MIVMSGIVGDELRFLSNILFENRNNGRSLQIFDYYTSRLPSSAVHERKNLVLAEHPTPTGSIRIIPQKSLIGFDNSASSSLRPKTISSHGFPDSMAHEPRGFKSNSQRQMELFRANSLFRADHHKYRLEPDSHRNMAILKDSADFDGERFAACVAFV